MLHRPACHSARLADQRVQRPRHRPRRRSLAATSTLCRASRSQRASGCRSSSPRLTERRTATPHASRCRPRSVFATWTPHARRGSASARRRTSWRHLTRAHVRAWGGATCLTTQRSLSGPFRRLTTGPHRHASRRRGAASSKRSSLLARSPALASPLQVEHSQEEHSQREPRQEPQLRLRRRRPRPTQTQRPLRSSRGRGGACSPCWVAAASRGA